MSRSGCSGPRPGCVSSAKSDNLGRLAQLGEHQLDKLGVTGSSPVPPIEKALHKGFFVARTGDNGVAVARIDGRIGRDGSLRNLVLSAAGFAVRTKSPGNRHLRGEAPVAAASSSPARCETPRCGYTGVAWRSSRCSCPAGTATRSGGRTAKDASATRTEGQDQEEILRPLSYETYKYRKCATVIRYLEVP